MHLDATEHRDGIVFLHAVKEGPASRSYGLAVAQLAGVPRESHRRRARIPGGARKGRRACHAPDRGSRGTRARPPPATRPRPSYRSSRRRRRRRIRACWKLEAALRAVNADDLTPRAALDLIYKLRSLLG